MADGEHASNVEVEAGVVIHLEACSCEVKCTDWLEFVATNNFRDEMAQEDALMVLLGVAQQGGIGWLSFGAACAYVAS